MVSPKLIVASMMGMPLGLMLKSKLNTCTSCVVSKPPFRGKPRVEPGIGAAGAAFDKLIRAAHLKARVVPSVKHASAEPPDVKIARVPSPARVLALFMMGNPPDDTC